MIKYEIINYFDVWGNQKDGFEVNDMCSEGFIEFPNMELNQITHKHIVNSLKNKGFFAKHVRMNMLDIWDEHSMIEFSRKINQQPICRLELREEN